MSTPITLSSSPQRRYPTKHVGVEYRLKANGQRSYVIIYTDSAGKRIYKSVPGQLKDAVRARAQILERMHRGELVVQSRLTVADLIEEYLRTQTNHLKPKTLQNYTYNLDHYVLPILGKRRLSALGVGDIIDFINEMRKPKRGRPSGYKKWTIQSCLTPMGAMFRYGVRQGWMSRNPIQDLHRHERPKGDPATLRILSTEEIQRFLAAAAPGAPVYQNGKVTKAKLDGAYHVLFTTAVFTGLRMGELLALRWEDVDLLAGRIKVKKSKTDSGIREVVIPDFLVRMLAGHLYTDGEVFKTREGQPMKARRVGRALEETLKRAGVPHVRFHDLRHTFASILISNGEHVAFVADQMGHANPGITLKLYAKLFDAEATKEGARKRMETNFAEIVE